MLENMIENEYGFHFSTSLFEPSGYGRDLHSNKELKILLRKIYDYFARKTHETIEEVKHKHFNEEKGIINMGEKVSMEMTLNGYPPCSVGRRDGFMINFKGEVFPCTSLRDREFFMGNILKEDIEPVKFFDRWIPPSIDDFPECENSPVKYFYVGGGCIARNKAFTGSLTKLSPYYKIFHIMVELIVWEKTHLQTDYNKLIKSLEWAYGELVKERDKYK